ncbi:MAG: sulfurtransferase TusA family protein [Chloroflexi bacterium]|nr:sulfurtransferase TusA family protein [Chloroflexota bacterium]
MPEIDFSTVKPAKVVDTRSSACPGPLLEAKKAMGVARTGETIELWVSDPESKENIVIWAQKVGHNYLGVIPGDGYDRMFVTRK